MADHQANYNGSLPGDIRYDDAAFELFFKDQFAPLCAWCRYRFDFDIDVSKDIVHTAFIQLWKNRHTLSAASAASAYLYKTIINRSLDILKHRRIQNRYEDHMIQQQNAADLTRDLEQFDLKKLQADIDKAVAELPEQMRRIFELSRYEGLKYGDIAARLNISVNTVETQMSRALAKLRVKLAEWLWK
jgi:RNA polymerase sigma-70 factor, ECF subfamily